MGRSPEQPDQLGSTFSCTRSTATAPCPSSSDRVSRCQVTLLVSTPAPCRAVLRASRRHRLATPGSQQQRRGRTLRSACSSAPTSARALSGGMTCQGDTDGLRTANGARVMCGLRDGDADTRKWPSLQIHDERGNAAFTCGDRLLLVYATAVTLRHAGCTHRHGVRCTCGRDD